MKQRLIIHIKGNNHNWDFIFQGDPKYLKEWQKDGLEVNELINSIPKIIVDLGLIKFWCFFEDLFNFRNPFN